MTTSKMRAELVDPGVLEIIGGVAQALGLAEQVQRILPTDRWRSQRRHTRIDKLLGQFKDNLDDARAALRLIRSAVGGHTAEIPRDAIGIGIPRGEIPVYRRGLQQLHRALEKMTDSAYEIETITAGVSTEAERFYRISQGGRPVLEALRTALSAGLENSSVPGHAPPVEDLLDKVDQYLTNCSQMLEDREKWLRQG